MAITWWWSDGMVRVKYSKRCLLLSSGLDEKKETYRKSVWIILSCRPPGPILGIYRYLRDFEESQKIGHLDGRHWRRSANHSRNNFVPHVRRRSIYTFIIGIVDITDGTCVKRDQGNQLLPSRRVIMPRGFLRCTFRAYFHLNLLCGRMIEFAAKCGRTISRLCTQLI
jgi:hypothetical protein